jgi:adenylosuccinate synthase
MPVTAVIGGQWGDEGKGKIVDYLSKYMDIVVRVNGGPNAGHTVCNEFGEFALHSVPVGIFNPQILCIIGSGTAIDPEILVEEITKLKSKGVSCRNLKISSKAHLILPWHILLDGCQESGRGKEAIGTTRRGIGPVFADKAARFGLRVQDLLDEDSFSEKFDRVYSQNLNILALLYCLELPPKEILKNRLLSCLNYLFPYIDTDSEYYVQEALNSNKSILLEGAQGTLLDPDFGTYPQTTSSFCTAAGACQGSGIPPNLLDEIIGIFKVYTSRVCGPGHPFPTEMPDDLAAGLRERAGEYGATTGRPRRLGWFDALLARYSAKINGFTGLALTRIDNLTGISPLKICYGYRTKKGEIPSCLLLRGLNLTELKDVEPLYFHLPGWKRFPKNPKNYSDLPFEARCYIETLENLIGVPVEMVSVGKEREQIVFKKFVKNSSK